MVEEVEKYKEQSINEIAKDLCSRYPSCTCIERDGHCSTPQQHAKIIYGLGYKKQVEGTWKYYSTTMMECSVCGRHTAKHRYEFCPHCGSKMIKEKVKLKQDTSENWKQLTFDDIHTRKHSQ